MTRRPSRRDLLTMLSLGAGAAALPAGAFSSPLGALARTVTTAAGAPRRMVFIDIPNGVTPDANGYNDFATAGSNPTSFTLGTLTRALEPLRDELVILDNLEMRGASGDTHFGGIKALLTGRWPNGGAMGTASNISLDLYLAEKLGRVLTPRFPSLNLGVQTDSITRSYQANGTPVPPNQDPYDVYRSLFSGITGGSAGPDAALLRRLARRQSVLDSVA